MKKLTHRECCIDLAIAKGTGYVEIPLGSVHLGGYGSNPSTGIADVLVVKPSYVNFNVDIFEVKVARSDFKNEIKTGKWKRYLEHCNRFYFACPLGLIKKEELPEGVGLVTIGDKGWHTTKAAKRRVVEIPYMTLLSLMFFNGRILNKKRSRFYYDYNFQRKKLMKSFGKKIARKIYFYNKYEPAIELAEKKGAQTNIDFLSYTKGGLTYFY